MPTSATYGKRQIKVYRKGRLHSAEAQVVSEIPLTLFFNNAELATLICSPGADRELAVGFLLSEGLIKELSDIKDISFREEEGLIWVTTHLPTPQTENFLRRHIASCCGKGRSSLYFINDAQQLQPVKSTARFAAPLIPNLMSALDSKSHTFRLTGGVHSAGLADGKDMLVVYEDIGRHNAVDKVLGYALLNRVSTEDKCLLLTGRISSEILIKAARIGIPAVVSRSAPTQLAVELADQLGLTLVGFARGEEFNVYSHMDRLSL